MTPDIEYRLSPGTVLADTYRIERRIGKGGMGEVYEASHARLSGKYAVKLLLREAGQVEEVLRRFKQEAEITSRLRHPNIVQVIDFAQMPDGTPFMVMEFLNGHDLAEELHQLGAIPLPRAVDILGQVAAGLAAAHAENIVHRDLKPANIFLSPLPGSTRELAKIVDFGISKVRAVTSGLTRTQTVIGTPQYMAPEQARGQVREIDSRTDQFALGAIAYEMLAGRPPFEGDEISAILYQIVHETPPSLVSQGLVDLGPADAAIRRAMSKNRMDRYPSVVEFIQALTEASHAPGLSGSSPVVRDPARQQTQLATPWPGSASALAPSPTTMGSSTGELDRSSARLSPPARSSRTWMAVVGGAIAVAGVTAGIVWGLTGPSRATSELATTTTTATSATSDKGAATTVPPPGAETPEPPPAPDVSVEFQNGPPGLQVAVDGRPTPQPLHIHRGDNARLLRMSAPGFKTEEQSVIPSKDLIIHLAMQPQTAQKEESEPAAPARTSHRKSSGGSKPPREGRSGDKNVVTDL